MENDDRQESPVQSDFKSVQPFIRSVLEGVQKRRRKEVKRWANETNRSIGDLLGYIIASFEQVFESRRGREKREKEGWTEQTMDTVHGIGSKAEKRIRRFLRI